jgi:hypothetical protein
LKRGSGMKQNADEPPRRPPRRPSPLPQAGGSCGGGVRGNLKKCPGCLSREQSFGIRLRQSEQFEGRVWIRLTGGGHFCLPGRWEEKEMSFALPLSLHIGKWTRCPLPLFCAARSAGLGIRLRQPGHIPGHIPGYLFPTTFESRGVFIPERLAPDARSNSS